MSYGDEYTDEEWEERVEMFADPGGDSALRATSPSNPRNLPCPNCGTENVLTPADRDLGYQCDACARAAEGFGGYGVMSIRWFLRGHLLYQHIGHRRALTLCVFGRRLTHGF